MLGSFFIYAGGEKIMLTYLRKIRNYAIGRPKTIVVKENPDDITDELERSLWGLKDSFDFDTEEIQIVIDDYKVRNKKYTHDK